MKRVLSLIVLLLAGTFATGQVLTQTIRGTILDTESKFPLADAMVICDQSQAFSDEYGQFSLEVEIGEKRSRSSCSAMSPKPL